MDNKINEAIYTLDAAICRHIDNINIDSRGVVSQDTLADLRHFTEHLMLKIFSNGKNLDVTYENICRAIRFIKDNGQYKLFSKFHDMLQIVVSHYKPTEESSERLMLKYYEILFKIRDFMRRNYDLELLNNLELFPLNIDPKLLEYYQKISDEIERYNIGKENDEERYYVHKIKPIFINNKIYYEVTFSPVNDNIIKTDRFIAFTKIEIETNYAAKISIVNTNIEIMNHKMPILVIVSWEISIRECEFNNFAKLFTGIKPKVVYSERLAICSFMTKFKLNLLDIVLLPDTKYKLFKDDIGKYVKAKKIFLNVLDQSRNIIKNNQPGSNIIRYLLYTMNNSIIKKQYCNSSNHHLSNLFIKYGVIPFDKLPLTFSPIKHNPSFYKLIECINVVEHKSELLARHIQNNTECGTCLFTELKEIGTLFEDYEYLVDDYNSKLWSGHRPQNELKIDKGHMFIHKYVEDCLFIIDLLKELSSEGVDNYVSSVDAWLDSPNTGIDCNEKKEVIKKMFSNSKVAVVYGAAGTGKSTLINHVAHFFSDKTKLFLAQTNPAVDNLRRKVDASNCDFMTITKFIVNTGVIDSYDILIIDECSTVSNSDMCKILRKATFKLLILVGDNYQIESIRFGNWFNIVKAFIPETSIANLTIPYRSKDSHLLKLWNSVRAMDDKVLELLTSQKYSNKLDDTVFEVSDDDEIVLCLNYDGLYGINNINRFLQESSSNEPVSWGIQTFKIGDPILFHETNRFGAVIYNNMKGRIVDLHILSEGEIDERIEFDIELDKIINGLDVIPEEFELLSNDSYEHTNNSVIRFSVYKNKNTDDDELDPKTIIPFQVSYAVSIHKAQGLEYNSVKVVITNEVDEMITHNIFYTAITRAKSQLKIFWSPEVENKLLKSMKPNSNNKDLALLYKVEL